MTHVYFITSRPNPSHNETNGPDEADVVIRETGMNTTFPDRTDTESPTCNTDD